MRNSLFLMTHLGSGSDEIFNLLCTNPYIDGFRTGIMYDHPEKLSQLFSNPHKMNNVKAIFLDEILHNRNFACKYLCSTSQFVFFIQSPVLSLNKIITEDSSYDAKRASDYYRYRLRGIYEYWKRTQGVAIIGHEIKNSIPFLNKYLDFEFVYKKKDVETKNKIDLKILEKCQQSYNFYCDEIKKTG